MLAESRVFRNVGGAYLSVGSCPSAPAGTISLYVGFVFRGIEAEVDADS